MSNYYLCDTCDKSRDSIPGEICPYRLELAGKIVCSDDCKREELCEHYGVVVVR